MSKNLNISKPLHNPSNVRKWISKSERSESSKVLKTLDPGMRRDDGTGVNQKLLKWITSVLLLWCGFQTTVWAATVTFADAGSSAPSAVLNANTGVAIDINIVGNGFTELAGGVMGFAFDSGAVQINSVNVNSALFAFLPDGGSEVAPGQWQGIGFDVDVIASAPFAAGDFTIATINLTPLATGASVLSILGSSEFFSSTAAVFPAMTDSTLQVSSVPLPSALILLLSGVGLLVGVGKRE